LKDSDKESIRNIGIFVIVIGVVVYIIGQITFGAVMIFGGAFAVITYYMLIKEKKK